MEYTIVEGFKAEEVIELVNERLKEGWELYGSLTVSGVAGHEDRMTNNLYAQAMIKKSPEYWSAA
ncbi:MAG: hypothetical protein WCF57_24070 [Pyrinomonadaceae bacterium]